MKETLASKHLSKISSHLTNGVTNPAEYGAILKEIHGEVVAESIAATSHSHVLGCTRPKQSPSESRLTRAERLTLAQHRSGECHLLGDYQVKTGRADCATCPECRFRSQNVHSGRYLNYVILLKEQIPLNI